MDFNSVQQPMSMFGLNGSRRVKSRLKMKAKRSAALSQVIRSLVIGREISNVWEA